MLPSGEAYIVSSVGEIFAPDSTNSQEQMPIHSSHALNAVFGTAANNIWAVGDGGVMLQRFK